MFTQSFGRDADKTGDEMLRDAACGQNPSKFTVSCGGTEGRPARAVFRGWGLHRWSAFRGKDRAAGCGAGFRESCRLLILGRRFITWVVTGGRQLECWKVKTGERAPGRVMLARELAAFTDGIRRIENAFPRFELEMEGICFDLVAPAGEKPKAAQVNDGTG